jgi:hypothetical protein
MKSYRKYLSLMFFILFLQSIIVIIFNIKIDPYGIWNSQEIAGINRIKPKQRNQVKLLKSVQIIHEKPMIVFLGSSSVNLGLSPQHPGFHPNSQVYNLGIPGSNMYETMRFFDHAIANQPNIQHIILGVDFFMFNKNRPVAIDFNEDQLGKNYIILPDLIKTTYSFDTLFNSIETIFMNHTNPGLNPYQSQGLQNEKYFKTYLLNNGSIPKTFQRELGDYLRETRFYGKFEFSPNALANFQRIVEICRQKNIKLTVFISPIHVTQLEAIEIAQLWDEFADWKRKLIKITPIWDFSGYNIITTEPISNQMKNYFDHAHYRQRIGNLMLNKMLAYNLGEVPRDFGVFLTDQNLDVYLKITDRQKILWEKKNYPTVQMIKGLR